MAKRRGIRRKPSRAAMVPTAEAKIEALIDEIHALGLHLNNLFELDNRWRANVADRNTCFEFGEGRTAKDALRAALQKISTAQR